MLIHPIATYAAEAWNYKVGRYQRTGYIGLRCRRAIFGMKLRDPVGIEAVRTVLNLNITIGNIIRTKSSSDDPYTAVFAIVISCANRHNCSNNRLRGRPPKSRRQQNTERPTCYADGEKSHSERKCGEDSDLNSS